MQAYTEEQRAAEIEQTKELRNHLNFWGHASGFSPEFLMRVTDAYLATLTAEPVEYQYRYYNQGSGCFNGWDKVYSKQEYDRLVAEHGGDNDYGFRQLYTTPPIAALRLPNTPADLSERDMKFRHAFGLGCAWYEEEVKRLNATATAVTVDPAGGDEKTVVVHHVAPPGWKLVPVNAFPSQWAAGQKAFESAGMNKIDAVYKAMVAAAPEMENVK